MNIAGGQVALDGAGCISAGRGGINGAVFNEKIDGLPATGNAQSIPTLCVLRVDQDRICIQQQPQLRDVVFAGGVQELADELPANFRHEASRR